MDTSVPRLLRTMTPRRLFTRYLAVFWLFICSVAGAELHTPQCIEACPEGAPQTNDVIVRSIYTLSSNDITRFADWVAYHVTSDSIGPSRQRVWRSDPALHDNETLEPEDYRDAHRVLGTDRGHLVPLASFSGTAQWFQTNYLSNITPQSSSLNQGAWKRLESAVRTLAKRQGSTGVYVLAGTIYEQLMPPLPDADEPHLVPSGYWKVIALPRHNELQVAGFVFPQQIDRAAKFCSFQVPLDILQQRTRFTLFPEVPVGHISDLSPDLLIALGCHS